MEFEGPSSKHFVEDIGLAVRKPVYSASDLETGISKEIDLRSFDDLSFRRGFEIKCQACHQ